LNKIQIKYRTPLGDFIGEQDGVRESEGIEQPYISITRNKNGILSGVAHREDYSETTRKRYCISGDVLSAIKKRKMSSPDYYSGLIAVSMTYVLKTANYWNGPIKRFELIVDKLESDAFVSFCPEGAKKIGDTLFKWGKTDLYPKKDLAIVFWIPNKIFDAYRREQHGSK
jgi:hypothetical protein